MFPIQCKRCFLPFNGGIFRPLTRLKNPVLSRYILQVMSPTFVPKASAALGFCFSFVQFFVYNLSVIRIEQWINTSSSSDPLWRSKTSKVRLNFFIFINTSTLIFFFSAPCKVTADKVINKHYRLLITC